MPKFTHKIEDLLENVAKEAAFSTEPPELSLPPVEDIPLTFPKILDFSFPTEELNEKVAQIGEVIYVGDGVCQVVGLDKVTMEEIIQIKTQTGIEHAIVLGIQENKVETVVMGDYTAISRGDQVKSTGSKLKIPAGPELMGRVINPLGYPIDGKGPIKASEHRDVEFPAPGVMDRAPILEPIHTGILSIDSTIPIGRGQRELVIGDRKTGKSRTMLDIICNQKGQDVMCIYVGVGIQAAKAKATVKLLESRGAMSYTTLVLAVADEPPSLQYMAPYVGAALGEHYMYQGKHALVIYDDLSKQAKAYRQVSLLLKRSPGRDAYPGDIFFLHSRLLERASKLSPDLKGGSLTALPVAETQTGDVSDYIITNLMSITDGHIYLDSNMMHEGILPAVNSGTSVSRIGGKVQSKLLQKVGELAGRISSRYNEVKSFETINTEVSEETMRDIKRGKRVKEIFSQDSSLSMSDDEEIVLLGIATSSRMDHLEMDHVMVFKEKFIAFYRAQDLSELKTLTRKSKNMEDIDPYLDDLFVRFSRRQDFPQPKK